MNKLLVLSILLPVIAGSTAGQGNVQDLYKNAGFYKESTQSIFSKEVKSFVNKVFKNKHCNPLANYKIQKEKTYPITDLLGQTVMVYSAEMRVFDEADQNSFNGYEGSKKFRKREFTIRQDSNGFSISDISCETAGWQRKKQ